MAIVHQGERVNTTKGCGSKGGYANVAIPT